MSQYPSSYYASSLAYSSDYPVLQGDIEVDVAIIGGGYTGVSTALHLAQAGFKVALLEAQLIGWGASGRNGGQVGVGQRQDIFWLEQKLGKTHAKQLWDLSVESVDLVKKLIAEHHINCDWHDGILHTAWKQKHVPEYQEEADKLHNDYQFSDCRFVDQQEVSEMLGTSRYYGGLIDNYSGHLHPLNYVLGLAEAAKKAGAQIFQRSPVTDYRGGEQPQVRTEQGLVKAKAVVLGCNGYLGKLNKRMAGKIMPINNFIAATEPLPDSMAKQLIRDNVAVADSKFVINYYRLSADNRLLFGGGETYSSRFPKDIKAFVKPYMLDIYPQLKDVRLDYGWGGTLAITLNRMPHFERMEKSVYVAQGFSGHGVAMATLAGQIISEAIAGDLQRFDCFAKVPTPTFPGGTLLRYPGLVAGMLYYSLLDRL